MESATSNVSDSLAFVAARALNANDPSACYADELIRCAAVAPYDQVRDLGKRLKKKYGFDLNLNEWHAALRRVREELVQAVPSGFILSENGNVKPILANAITELRRSGVSLGFDSFTSRVVIIEPSPWGSMGVWTDLDALSASNYLQHNRVAVRSDTAQEAAVLLAHERPFHPVRDWLNSLQWDGNGRIDRWLIDFLGARDDAYQWNVGSKWLIAAVARIMKPGCLARNMIVLEGTQGAGKSRALRALTNGHLDGSHGVQWFRDALPDIDKTDIGLYMQGVWIIEIGELEAIRGKQWTKVKAFISSQTDVFRRPYGRNMHEYPRQCIFAASTNETQWGGDHTGLTRFWPIAVGQINIEGLLKNREQIWAEAVHRYDAGEAWWLDEAAENLAKLEQSDRMPTDSWTENVAAAIKVILLNCEDFSVSEILDCMNISRERQDAAASARVARALHGLGYQRQRASGRYRKE